MGFEYAKAGIGSVGNYQVSGVPYVTGGLSIPGNTLSALEIVFPSITQRIHIQNNDSANGLRVGFSANGVKNSNHWLVEKHDSTGKGLEQVELRVKTDRIFLISNTSAAVTGAYIAAELSGIKLDFNLASSSYSGSAGIG